jgi:hypothetical protein
VQKSIRGVKCAFGRHRVGAKPLSRTVKSDERSALTVDTAVIIPDHNVISGDLVAKVGWAGGQASLGGTRSGWLVHKF